MDSLTDIDEQLSALSAFLSDPDVGHVMRREANEAVDSLLDDRNTLIRSLGSIALQVQDGK